jgi:hypothetical protein
MQAMTEGDEPPQPRLWSYPRRWMCQQQFWFEMSNRTLSSLLVALVILLAGESAGLFHQPWLTVGKTVLAGAVWVSLLGVAVAALGLLRGWRDRARVVKHARDPARAPKLEAQPAEQEAQHQAGEGSDGPEDGKLQREV